MSRKQKMELSRGNGKGVRNLYISLFLILIAGINFSLLFSVNKIAMESGIPFFSYVFWYAFGAGIILFIIAAIRRELPSLKANHLRAYSVAAILGFAFPFALLAFVAPKLPSGVAVLLVILTPAFTYVFSLIGKVEKLHILSVLGLVLGIGGVLCVVIPSGSLPDSEMAGWFLLALLAPICFAGLNFYAEISRPPDAPSLALAVGILLSSALLLLPLMLGTGQFYMPPGEVLKGDLALSAAVLINILMWPLFYETVKRAGAFLFSMVNVVGVLAGLLWSIVIFGEEHSAFVWVAALLMLLGLGLIILRPVFDIAINRHRPTNS